MADTLARLARRVVEAELIEHRDALNDPLCQAMEILVKHGMLIDPENPVADQRLDVPACARCGCTEDNACEGGCAWQPNPQLLDLCSGCINRDGSCTTPGCGASEDDLDVSDPTVWGWILFHVHGSVELRRWLCSPWCVNDALHAAAAELEAADLAAAAGGEH